MTDRFPRGLVVGKFCPLHLGHEALIRHAALRCDELVVLSYTKPGFDGYDRERRQSWLRSRFPTLACHAIDDDWLATRCAERGIAHRTLPDDAAPADDHRRFVAWLMTHLLGGPVQAVCTSESYGDGFAAVLAEVFGAPVRHVCVDPARSAVPISGTRLRLDPMACRPWLSEEVYADLVPRIALIGGESTGKSTLARGLAEALGTVWAPEYGRERWEAQGGVLSFDDMEAIARAQVEREHRQALLADRWLVCDTTPLTTRFYSETMFGRVSAALERLARRRYDMTFLCAADFPFEQDGTRRDEKFRAAQQAWYRDALRARGVRFEVLEGPIDHRVEVAVRGLRAGRR